MVENRSSRARARLRTTLLGAAVMASGAVLSSWSSAQELPGGVATDLFEQAMQEDLTVPDAAPEATRTEVEVATVRRPKRPSKPKEGLKLPPHAVAFLQKTAAKRPGRPRPTRPLQDRV